MREWLLVDGYNVLNSWQEFKQLRVENLEHARELLLAKTSEYGAFKGLNVVLVFDATDAQGMAHEERRGGICVVFTSEGETADTWIEKKTYELVQAGERVFVVTSDYAQQIFVLGAGAYRISAREFREEYQSARKKIQERGRKEMEGKARSEVGSRLNEDVLDKLELLRRKK